MTYTPQYPGGWHDQPNTTTPITAAALAAIDAGLLSAVFGATDGSLILSGAAGAQTLRTATLDQIAALQAPAANWSNNSRKITNLLNGTAAQDAAAFGQIPLVDSTAADITEDGTQAAGAAGKWADGGHVHPFAGGMWLPSDDGLAGANTDPATGSGGGLPVAGNLYLQRIIIRRPQPITNLFYWCSTVGAGASSGSFAGLFNSAGTRQAVTNDIGSLFTGSTGRISCPLTAPTGTLPVGVYWSAAVFNLATTQPTLWRSVNTSSIANGGLSAANFRWAINGTGQTSIPASITPSSNATTAFTFVVGWN